MNNEDIYRHKIALIIPWYGPFPWYWRFFVHSMRYNPSIDCIIVTDEEIKEDIPYNIKVHHMSLSEVQMLASNKMGFHVCLNYPYKLCDLKPAYGLIFEDLLGEYDFWGHGDIDLIFGNIRNFMTDSLLDSYDIVSVRRDYLTGYFLLFRNTEYMKLLFTKSKDYRMVYQSKKGWCFDECNHMHRQIYANKENILNVTCDIDSMEHVVQREIKDGNLRASYSLMAVEGIPGNIKWENGLLLYKGKFEILLYHFISFKALDHLYVPKWNSMPNTIIIEDNFITSPSEKRIERLKCRLSLTIHRLIVSIRRLIQVNLIGRYFSSTTIKKREFNDYFLIGNYRMGHSSILYEIGFSDNYLYLIEGCHYRLPLYHLWANTFITPDFETIIRGQVKGNNILFRMDKIGSKTSWLIKN